MHIKFCRLFINTLIFAGAVFGVIVRMQPKIPCTGFHTRVVGVPLSPQLPPMNSNAQLQER
jgi:hypothetical protein